MSQAARIHMIFQWLKSKPATIEEIWTYLQTEKVKVQKRQLYWDLEHLEKHYLRPEETLLVLKGAYNRKTYAIHVQHDSKELSTFDINSYQLGVSTMSLLFEGKRGHSMHKFKMVLDEAILKEGKLAYTYLDSDKLLGTHFYEAHFSPAFNDAIEDMIWAVSNNKMVAVETLMGDPTSLFATLECPFLFKPISILYHRGEFFLAGFATDQHIFTTLDISKIQRYSLTNKTFAYKKLQQNAKLLLGQRFGVTNNMDEHVYEVKLEFSSVTGEFVSRFHWHHSQQFEPLSNGNWLCTFTCGINRELVGWIFQWMGNVKIITPQILTDLYQQQLKKINDIYESSGDLHYSNVFKP